MSDRRPLPTGTDPYSKDERGDRSTLAPAEPVTLRWCCCMDWCPPATCSARRSIDSPPPIALSCQTCSGSVNGPLVNLVWGVDDPVGDRTHAQEILANHPRATITTVDGAGHQLPATHSALCVAQLIDGDGR